MNGQLLAPRNISTRKAASGVWALNEATLQISTDTWPTVQDPQFANVAFLFHANAVIGQVWPFDSSGAHRIATANSSSHTVNSGAIFPSMSYTSSGNAGFVTAAPNVVPGTGDWSLECWMQPSVVSAGSRVPADCRPAGANGWYPTFSQTAATVSYFANSAARITTGSILVAGTNYYLAAARTSGVTYFYIGTQGSATAALVGSVTDTNTYPNINLVSAGGSGAFAAGFTGLVDEVRLTVGTGAGRGYTGSTIPVPTARFPDY